MANINLDFSNVAKREAIPEGVYESVIATAEEKMSKNGKPMLTVGFDITTDNQSNDVRIWENYVLQENTLWKLSELLNVLGYDVSGALDFDPNDLIGSAVRVKVVQEDYNGNAVNRIKKILN